MVRLEIKKNILIVDDDKFILNIFCRILQKQGYNVDVVETGQETLEKMNEKKYDLVLIDVNLPDVNGIDLVSKINSINPGIIKIILTGFPSIEDATNSMDQGVAAYLVKPVKSEELIALIANKLK